MEFKINFQHVRFIGLDKQPTIHLIALHESQFLFQIVLLNISTTPHVKRQRRRQGNRIVMGTLDSHDN